MTLDRKKIVFIALLWFPVVVLADYYGHSVSKLFGAIMFTVMMAPYGILWTMWFENKN